MLAIRGDTIRPKTLPIFNIIRLDVFLDLYTPVMMEWLATYNTPDPVTTRR
jgi:hypothetical protein